MKNLLVANRGEIAVRIMHAAAELGIRTVAVFSEDDASSLHTRRADEAHPLRGMGAAAYLDIEQIVAVATECGCDAIHPGYGFLSENAAFARRCAAAGITFVGPRAETLEIFGDKTQARALAERCGVPVLPGTSGAVTPRRGQELSRVAGQRRRDDDQGGRRRRRPRHARRASPRRGRGRVRALPVGSAAGVRQRRRVRRAADAARPAHRGADRRRRLRRA